MEEQGILEVPRRRGLFLAEIIRKAFAWRMRNLPRSWRKVGIEWWLHHHDMAK